MKRQWAPLFLILLLGLGARLVYARLLWTPWFKDPGIGQSFSFTRNCYLLAAGLGYSGTDGDTPADRDSRLLIEKGRKGRVITPEFADSVSREGLYPEMLHPFGWAGVAVLLHRLTHLPIESVMQVAGAVVDTATIGLTYALVVLCLGSRRLGLACSFIYAIFPPSLYLATRLFPLAFMPFFAALATLFVVHSTRYEGLRRYVCYALAGLTLGIASYFRSDLLLLGPFFFLGLWVHHRRLISSLAVGVGIFAISMATLVPWAWRNHRICGNWVFTSSSAGVTLVTGLGAYPNPWGIGGTDEDRMREAAEQGFERWTDPKADAYFRREFTEAVKQNPGAYLKILARRLVTPVAVPYDWGRRPPKDTISYTKLRRSGNVFSNIRAVFKRVWLRLISAGVMFVSLVGCLVMLWKEWRTHPLILFPILVPVYAAASHVFTYMAPYYLWPGAFAQLIGLGYLLCKGWRRAEQPDRENLGAERV